MEWLNLVITRLRGLLRRESVLQDIEEELRLHIEMETQTNIERGLRPEEARPAGAEDFWRPGPDPGFGS